MPAGPSLIFDKSSLESLNLDEAALMDSLYMSTITPLFFVECLALPRKAIRSKSTPEQLVGSLADRTPEAQSQPNDHLWIPKTPSGLKIQVFAPFVKSKPASKFSHM